MNLNSFLMIVGLSLAVTGCSSFKNPFSGNDNSVLPGEREEVLPPDQQTARDPIVTGDQPVDAQQDAAATPAPGDCKLNDPNCDPGIDQEAGTAGIE